MVGYIGGARSVVSSGAERKQTYAITTTTSTLTGLAYTPSKVHVFHNGIRLVDGTDYTATDGTSITLTNAAQDGDEIVVISNASFQTSDTVSAANGGTFAGNVAFNNSVGVGTEAGTYDLDIKKNIAQDQIVRVGSEGGGGRTIMFADVLATPTKYNFQIGTQSNVNNGFEITPSTTVGGTTFTNPALTIDENGYVKKPTQPVFSTHGNSATYSGQVFLGSSIPVNQGNHYNSTNGRFTAPVAGVYMFTAAVTTEDTGSNFLDIRINGSQGSAGGLHLSYGYTYINASMTCFTTLSAGDYVQVWRRYTNSVLYKTTFAGCLIA